MQIYAEHTEARNFLGTLADLLNAPNRSTATCLARVQQLIEASAGKSSQLKDAYLLRMQQQQEGGGVAASPPPELPGLSALQSELEKHSHVTHVLLDVLACRSIPGVFFVLQTQLWIAWFCLEMKLPDSSA